MKRNAFIASFFAFALIAGFFFTNNANATLDKDEAALEMTSSCPTGTVSVQGCIEDLNGCTVVQTTNGRTIYIKILSGISVGVGDEAFLTGQFVIDQDCNPCVLVVQSATDLGDC